MNALFTYLCTVWALKGIYKKHTKKPIGVFFLSDVFYLIKNKKKYLCDKIHYRMQIKVLYCENDKILFPKTANSFVELSLECRHSSGGYNYNFILNGISLRST